jgi:hypothetical protein
MMMTAEEVEGPLIVPMSELTCSESVSGESGLAVEISQVLDISLSELQAWYFRDGDMSSEVDQRSRIILGRICRRGRGSMII